MFTYIKNEKTEKNFIKNKVKQINGGTAWFFSPSGQPFFKFDIPENYLKVKKHAIAFTSKLEITVDKACEIEGFRIFKGGEIIFEADMSFFSGMYTPHYFLGGDILTLDKQNISWSSGFSEDKE